MIAFRDRTYCTAACGTTCCPAMLTDEIQTAAFDAGLPLSMADLRAECLDWTEGPRLLVCDVYGAMYFDMPESDSEWCECGRLKQRIEWA